MKRGMTIEYLNCRTELNFEVDFEVNGAIGAIVTKLDLILLISGQTLIFATLTTYESSQGVVETFFENEH